MSVFCDIFNKKMSLYIFFLNHMLHWSEGLTLQSRGSELVFCRCRSLFPLRERRDHRERFFLRVLSTISWLPWLWSPLKFTVDCMVESTSKHHSVLPQQLWLCGPGPAVQPRVKCVKAEIHIMWRLWWTRICKTLVYTLSCSPPLTRILEKACSGVLKRKGSTMFNSPSNSPFPFLQS